MLDLCLAYMETLQKEGGSLLSKSEVSWNVLSSDCCIVCGQDTDTWT